jgi:D-alanine-D-alanine ligase
MMRTTRVLIAHNRVEDEDDLSTLDVLNQVDLVQEGLDELGVASKVVVVDEHRVWETIRPDSDEVVFNLVEAPPGSPQLQSAAAAVLELLGVPFTGCRAGAMWLTTDKLATRAILASCGLPVAPGGRLWADDPHILDTVPPPWIIKPGWEDASIGLEGSPVCFTREQAIARARGLERRFTGQPLVLEHFLPGREFNVALLDNGAGADVLPVAEMAFIDFPPDIPALISYEGKWLVGSFADEHTQRRFPSDEEDGDLLVHVRALARRTWTVCGLSGYARVDMRLDEQGMPCILEVNANPCLSSEAGYVIAAGNAGLTPGMLIERILSAAMRVETQPAQAVAV